MIFLSYEFIWFALIFFPFYYVAYHPTLRLAIIIVGGIVFQFHYGGWTSVVPIAVLATVTFLAGRVGGRLIVIGAIVLCLTALAAYKYAAFIAVDAVGSLLPELGQTLRALTQVAVPVTIPLGISFFTFEFVHYLADVRRGDRPIFRFREFLGFAFFWPTIVAGPIRRYQQFVPALNAGLARPTAEDAAIGMVRVATGFVKKWVADNLTGWVDYFEPHFFASTIAWRWLFVAALAARILLDFSGYSDMAIGFARMMGIKVPENFNWPYLARTPIEFWQRWHISLSLWIRDYIYIPLGGNRLGLPHRIINILIAMALCGLWHGAAWNFVVWGLYHGAGLTIAILLRPGIFTLKQSGRAASPASVGAAARETEIIPPTYLLRIRTATVDVIAWMLTMIFVSIGWLLFFYPLAKALPMALGLFAR